ncbi:response regulator [Variovorax sp. J22R133]|uniref:adenylate/guanylate cyclase domain-containing protein n=1 Tax=Variovorax brevis TaxID=3053503 RepID=UPI00257605E1|nr:response regulator [Variovorax sp. J22R133]MDM0116558.1 response regulator [Variovorax sp. J22R133]
MRTPPRILIVDDNATNVKILVARLGAEGYDVVSAADGEEGLAAARQLTPDLILLDVMMPKLDGIEVCRRLRADPDFPFVPIIVVTAMTDLKDVVAGLEAGADEYLTKPVDHAALAARVRSMLRIKRLHDQVEGLLAQMKEWNVSLERRVATQVAELERVGRLRRFFSPQLAEAIVSGGAEDPLQSHRREITVVFLDLRGFTAFAESAEPEDVMGVLRQFHAATGELILEHEGTLEHFAGDGMMIFFNDPVPVPDAAERAVRMSLAIRARLGPIAETWLARGFSLGLGIGIAQGFATIGAIGFEGRWDYGAIGTVTNLAARLCGEAAANEILISRPVYAKLAALLDCDAPQSLSLKGFQRPVDCFSVRGMKATASASPTTG